MSLVVCTYDKSPYHAKVNEKIQWDEELKWEVQIYSVCIRFCKSFGKFCLLVQKQMTIEKG